MAAIRPTTLSADQLAAYQRVTRRVHEYLTDRLDADALDLVRLYRHHRDLYLDRVQRIYDAFLVNEPTLIRARTTPAWNSLLSVTQDTADQLGRDLLDLSVQNLTQTLRTQPQRIAPALRDLFGPVTSRLTDLPVSTQWVLNELTTTIVGGGTYLDRLLMGAEDVKQALFGSVRSGLLNGDDFSTVRARLMQQFGVDRMTAPKYNAYGTVKAYQNEARRYWNERMRDAAQRVGGLEVWWAMIDSPTVTPGCVARHGRAINELGEVPPRHYNCRCTVAVLPAETDLAPFVEDANRRLAEMGFTRRRALAQESEAGAWDEKKYTRHKRGSQRGGQFASKGGGDAGGGGGDDDEGDVD